jgi:hypothetical protein
LLLEEVEDEGDSGSDEPAEAGLCTICPSPSLLGFQEEEFEGGTVVIPVRVDLSEELDTL